MPKSRDGSPPSPDASVVADADEASAVARPEKRPRYWWRRDGVLGDMLSTNAAKCRPAIHAAFGAACAFVCRRYGPKMGPDDAATLRAICRNGDRSTRTSAMLAFVLVALAREVPLYEELVAEYQYGGSGGARGARASDDALEEKAIVDDLLDFRVVLCTIARSIMEISVVETNAAEVVDGAILTAHVAWKSLDSRSLGAFVGRHVVVPSWADRRPRRAIGSWKRSAGRLPPPSPAAGAGRRRGNAMDRI